MILLGKIVSAALESQHDRERLMAFSAEANSLLESYKAGDAKCVNCAECNCELLAKCHAAARAMASDEDKQQLPQPVAGYISGRPYCLRCLN